MTPERFQQLGDCTRMTAPSLLSGLDWQERLRKAVREITRLKSLDRLWDLLMWAQTMGLGVMRVPSSDTDRWFCGLGDGSPGFYGETMADALDAAARGLHGPGYSVGEVFGKWPGDETTAELLDGLKKQDGKS